jgi:hypothetical protein
MGDEVVVDEDGEGTAVLWRLNRDDRLAGCEASMNLSNHSHDRPVDAHR